MTAWSETYKRECGPKRKELCVRGHALAETRVVTVAASGRKTYSCRACNATRTARYKKADPSKYRESSRRTKLKANYGLTEEDYQKMLVAQHGVCAICFRHQRYQRLSVDHCHKTGKVRGLLCMHCNRALGHMFDSPSSLRQAALYLEKSKAGGIREAASSGVV